MQQALTGGPAVEARAGADEVGVFERSGEGSGQAAPGIRVGVEADDDVAARGLEPLLKRPRLAHPTAFRLTTV
jgi:hypothetical protein